MTLEIGLVLAILAVSLALFVSERLRMDVVALLVLGTLAVSGLVTPAEALAGFSNPAVITVWAMFMLSAGLERTGVANVIGQQVLRLAGRNETRMVAVIMLTAGGLSAFMNNIGVAALLLPVVMDIARRTGRPPSRLLMPLAFGSLLGGLTTLVGTPPNLLVSEALTAAGLEPFGMFDFAPVGGAVMLAGVAFITVIGRRILPTHDIGRESSGSLEKLEQQYAIHERTVLMSIGPASALIGRTLEESRLGSAAGLNVFAVLREGSTIPAPHAGFVLQAHDQLEVEGRLDRLQELQGWRELVLEEQGLGLDRLVSVDTDVAELRLSPDSELVDRTLREIEFRRTCGAIVLALRRESEVRYRGLADTRLQPGDRLLVVGARARIEALAGSAASSEELARHYRLQELLFTVRVPAGSVLVGRTLGESRLGDALGLGVLGVARGDRRNMIAEADLQIEADDLLLVRGRSDDLDVFRGLQALEIEGEAPFARTIQSEQIGLVEAILTPRSSLAGQTLKQLDFRRRYGLQAMAILRQGQVVRSELRDVALRFGDALLLFGRRERLQVLAGDPDLLALTEGIQQVRRTEKALTATVIMAAVVIPVLAGWLPIAIAAVAGATLMVVSRCLTMEEAYRAVEWRSIFLIAGMLPLGVAMQQTGAANLVAAQVLRVAGPFGAGGVLVGLYLATAVATTIIPTAALVVLMAPIALRASAELGVSPQAMMMAVAIAASASFTSPISHPANVLVMGPGGYRFKDYVKTGVPLAIVVMIVSLLLLPVFWPL